MTEDWRLFFTRAPVRIRGQSVQFRGEAKQVAILDFMPEERHSSASFGTQWGKYRNVQIDRFNGTTATYDHLKMITLGDPEILRGKSVLEIGSGAGRFTDYLVDIASRVFTVDPSAIFHNVALGADNLVPIRADLFDIPIGREMVDVVFCRGVVQHTGDTRGAIARLFDYVKPGGVVIFDVYHFKWFTPFVTKYWIRPATRVVPTERLIRLAEAWVPPLLRFKNRWVKPLLPKDKFGVNLANQIIPVADFTDAPGLDAGDRIRWSVLDTVDMYAPRYDRPMTWRAVMKLMKEIGARNVRADRRSFCFMANAP